jgi:hypothetical protein
MARRAKAREPVPVTEAIAYLRVSTVKQAASGLGLEAQAARIEAYCKGRGWKLVETFTDAGVSAKTLDRPELQKAIDALRPGRALVALNLDRLTRTARDLDDLIARVQATGGEWATVEGNCDTSTAMGRCIMRLMAEIDQMEREIIAERGDRGLPGLVWRPCSECLPETRGRVLVTIERRGQRFVAMAAYINGQWYLDGFEPLTARVLAWAEQPEPWDGDVDDGPGR